MIDRPVELRVIVVLARVVQVVRPGPLDGLTATGLVHPDDGVRRAPFLGQHPAGHRVRPCVFEGDGDGLVLGKGAQVFDNVDGLVLGVGPVPLKVLQRHAHGWAEAFKPALYPVKVGGMGLESLGERVSEGADGEDQHLHVGALRVVLHGAGLCRGPEPQVFNGRTELVGSGCQSAGLKLVQIHAEHVCEDSDSLLELPAGWVAAGDSIDQGLDHQNRVRGGEEGKNNEEEVLGDGGLEGAFVHLHARGLAGLWFLPHRVLGTGAVPVGPAVGVLVLLPAVLGDQPVLFFRSVHNRRQGLDSSNGVVVHDPREELRVPQEPGTECWQSRRRHIRALQGLQEF
mmetsp:Transcript_27550/g.80432  ORF Transcript_27550/g.80432 Transcript_27550/m.80432 type:complete len:342 (+) Transcript_27550:180-1205(+)